ncbi:CBS domain-containing protein [Candidatus Profftella armatura (Diaphorina cf. continua)]|uniref:Magnesium and cobalt efflux protein CorC n=1 Tax=Candidatus Profftella armatura (Diaphorina cf. continua) TaxID=2661583 RepID=A0A7R6W040_9PROT|nr:transporter associated domain-containing protein [Candidatus Profftella armatura (Diaphorina cf. continua)]BCG49648.1 CBS domain-containing protein [Candidatus Profftella armatura (Diaphorina cf. continua)]
MQEFLNNSNFNKSNRSLFERLTAFISSEPENRTELLNVLQDAYVRNLIDSDTLSMIKGVFQVLDLSVHKIMIPRSQMDIIDINQPIKSWIPNVLNTAHSRFPVIESDRDKVIGILLAKDLLRYYANESFDLRKTIRPAIFIPETKRLNILLRDFRSNHNHMAIVVDEYGGVSGLITIEDVLEQIVGDIEDEYDTNEDKDDILPIKDNERGHCWKIKGLTEISHCNEVLGTKLSNTNANTIGGFIANNLRRVPVKGDKLEQDGILFTIISADERKVHIILAERIFTPLYY